MTAPAASGRALSRSSYADAATRLGAVFTGKALGLVSVPIIARALGPETYGTFALVMLFAQYAAMPVEFGFRAHGIREVARAGDGSRVVSDLLSARLTLALFAYAVAALVGLVVFRGELPPQIVALSLVAVFAAALDTDFFYFGQRRFGFPSILDVGLQALYVLGVVLWVHDPTDLIILVTLTVLQPLTNSLVLLCHGSLRMVRIRVSFSHALRTFRKVMWIGLGAKGALVFNTVPLAVVGLYAARADVGMFASGMKLYGMLGLAMQTTLQVLAPRIVGVSRAPAAVRRRALRRLTGLALGGSAVLAAVLWVAAPPLVGWLFGPEFAGSVPILRALGVALMPVWLLYLLFVSWLNNFGEDAAYVRGAALLVASVVPLALVLVPRFGVTGAITSMFAAAILTTAYYGFAAMRTVRDTPSAPDVRHV